MRRMLSPKTSRLCQLFPGWSRLHMLCLVALLSGVVIVVASLGYFRFPSTTDDADKSGPDSGNDGQRPGPDMDYAVLVDAGSSGSRLFIYTWPSPTAEGDSGNRDLLQIRPMLMPDGQPVVKKIEPGLSSVAKNPDRASDYMLPLLEHAAFYVPVAKHRSTPLYILATAGLRLLPTETRDEILTDLRTDVPRNFSFAMPESGVEVITGRQEGIFQWLAINYVLGRFSHDSSGPLAAIDLPQAKADETPLIFRKKTVGILDMGGASMQIAVELTSKLQAETLQEEAKSAVADINLGCDAHDSDRRYRVFVTTYLGMGANEAKKGYEEDLLRSHAANASAGVEILDPCAQSQHVRNLTAIGASPVAGLPQIGNATFSVRGTGDFDACSKRLALLTRQLLHCPGLSCMTEQLPMHVELNDFYGFSEFWYTMEDVLKIGGAYQYYKFRKVAKNFCSVDWPVIEQRFRDGQYPMADRNRVSSQCFKSAWVASVIHQGLGWRTDYTGLRSSANLVRDQVVHWSLGAVLLKTRFLPLGRQVKTGNSVAAGRGWTFHLNSFTLVLCFGVVLAAILLYLKQLRSLGVVHPVGGGGSNGWSGSRSRVLRALSHFRLGKKRTSECCDDDSVSERGYPIRKPLLMDDV